MNGEAGHAHGRCLDMDRLVRLRAARDLVDRCFQTRLDLDRLADEAGFSRFHFARSFRAAFGETPGRYLTRRRIERAKQLLAGGNLTVTEVCYLVGFQSLGSFSARFAELVGVPPSTYRDEQVALGGPPPIPGCIVMVWSRPDTGFRIRASTEKPIPGWRSSVDHDP